MRTAFASIAIAGVVIIGEGEKDRAPMLANGERVGACGPAVDIAVDPVDGTRAVADDTVGALAVIAMAARGSMFAPGPIMYMDKIAVGRSAADSIDLAAPIADNLTAVARALGKPIAELGVAVLDRARNANTLARAEAAGARVHRLATADLAAVIACGIDGTGIDVALGIGGSPETVIAACALACLGGEILCRPWPRDQADRDRAAAAGIDLARVRRARDLTGGGQLACVATGITASTLVDAVRVDGDRAETHSLIVTDRAPPDALRRWHPFPARAP